MKHNATASWLALALLCAAAFAQLAAAEEPAATSEPPPIPVSISIWDSPLRAKVEKALAEPTDVDFQDTPLDEALETLAKRHSIPILIDRKALMDEGIGYDSPVLLTLKGEPLESVLHQITRCVDCTFELYREVILVTTPIEAESLQDLRVYPVADLVRAGWSRGAVDRRAIVNFYDQLIDVVESGTDLSSWSNRDGGAGIACALPAASALVVENSFEVHREIERLLSGLRQSVGLAPSTAPTESASIARPTGGSVREGRVSLPTSMAREQTLRKLGEISEARFVNTPLTEAVGTLSRRHGLSLLLDHRALTDEGIRVDMRVTFELTGVSLATMLDLLLRDIDATYAASDFTPGVIQSRNHSRVTTCVVRDAGLLITTTIEAESLAETRLYAVCELARIEYVPRWSRDIHSLIDSSSFDFDPLIDLVYSVVDPTTWDNGNSQQIQAVDPLGVLMVSQTFHVQQKIEALFAALRRARDAQHHLLRAPPRPVAAKRDPLQQYWAVYRFRAVNLPYDAGYADDSESGLYALQCCACGAPSSAVENVDTIEPRPLTATPEEARDAIVSSIDPASWYSDGEKPPRGTILVTGESLVIRHTADVHRRITTLLQALGVCPDGPLFINIDPASTSSAQALPAAD